MPDGLGPVGNKMHVRGAPVGPVGKTLHVHTVHKFKSVSKPLCCSSQIPSAACDKSGIGNYIHSKNS